MSHEQRIAEIRELSDRVTKRKPAGMTEQGQKGLLWTLFDGDVGARRICSAANPDDARFIQSLYEHREELLTLAAECLRLREDKKRLDWLETGESKDDPIEWPSGRVTRKAIDKARQALDAAKEAK